MSKTIIGLTFSMSYTGSIRELGKRIEEFEALARQTGLLNFNFNCQSFEAYNDGTQSDAAVGGNVVGRSGPRTDAAARAADDFDTVSDDESEQPDPDADKPKRRGRPPGSRNRRDDGEAAGSGKAEGGRKRADREAGTEVAGRDEPRGSAKGGEPAAGQGQGRAGRADRVREGDGSAGEKARISTGEDRGEADDAPAMDQGWDDDEPAPKAEPRRSSRDADDGEAHHAKTPDREEKDGTVTFMWPEHLMPEEPVTKDSLSLLLAQHFEEAGEGDRGKTLALMKLATNETRISDVDPRDYDNLAAALLKQNAQFRLGIKPSRIK